MMTTVTLTSDGTIACTKIDGAPQLEDLVQLLHDHRADPDAQHARGLLEDYSDASLTHLSFRDLVRLARARNEIRRISGDQRPTALVASRPVTFGLARTIAALEECPSDVFTSRAEARAWIEACIKTAAAPCPNPDQAISWGRP